MQKQFEYQGTKSFYQVSGVGKPVVLLHGFGEDSKIWNEQVNFLKDHFQVIVPDIPGTGKSALLAKENAGIEVYAPWLHALAEHEKLENFILLGHSMGGYITLAFAEKFPEKIKAFGLIHSTAFADSEEKKETRKKGIKLIKENGAFPFLKNTTPNLFSANFKKQQAEKVSALIEESRSFSSEALVQYYTAMMNRPDRTVVLEKSNVPVLFIIGDEDVAAPLDDLLKQVHLPKISHIHILKGVGHMSMLEEPAQLNNHLLSFISGVL